MRALAGTKTLEQVLGQPCYLARHRREKHRVDARIAGPQSVELRAAQGQRLGRFERAHRRSAPSIFAQQGQFAESLARRKHRQYRLLALRCRHPHRDQARHQQVKGVGRVPFVEHGLSGAEPPSAPGAQHPFAFILG